MKKTNWVYWTIRHLILLIIVLSCALPILLVVSISLTDIDTIYEFGYSFIPQKISTTAYQYIFEDLTQILRSYGISMVVTFVGGAVSLILTAMIAYTLSRKDYKYHKVLNFFVFFTMLFNGGLVPFYIVVTRVLHLKNSIIGLILPYLILAWFVLLLRSFFINIPNEIIESARVDGCNEFKIFSSIILPMSKPALATIGLMIILRYWNDWWLSLLFIDEPKLMPLQYLLQRIMNNIQELADRPLSVGTIEVVEFPSESARMAMAVIAAGPMLFIFPFFQKYFVKGLAVGSVKG